MGSAGARRDDERLDSTARRAVCFNESDGFMVMDMKSKHQALEHVSSHTELNDYYIVSLTSDDHPPYFRVGTAAGGGRTGLLRCWLINR